VRDHLDAFHLAVPAYDLDAAVDFYVGQLGCKLARRYPDRVTVDFFGDQLVCHLTDPPADAGPPTSLYPRHFGVTFRQREDFDRLVQLCELRKVPFFQPVGTRFGGRPEAHRTFALCDPSHNILEFKQYDDPRMMY
jgi:extradiol dioxygenase family protein